MERLFNYGHHVKAQGRPIQIKENLDLIREQLQAGEHISALLRLGSSSFALLVRTEDDFVFLERKRNDGCFDGLFAISDDLALKADEI